VRIPLRLPAAARNPISLIGGAIATATAFTFLVMLSLQLLGYLNNPYIGLVVYIAIPAAFLVGLFLIPLGTWWTTRRRARGIETEWPVIDLREPHQRSLVVSVLALTFVNVLIVSIAAYGGVHHMESTEFCGTTCHTPMEPEYTAHQAGPHARIACVQCHVGPGVGPLVESKLAGTRQLWEVMTNSVPRPIPPPPALLSPTRETCEQCHWPERFIGDRLRVIREYGNDEKNTESMTVMQVHVGGGSPALGVGTGIHWHMNLANRIEYIATDEKRETIPYVRLTDQAGNVREYVAEGTSPQVIASGVRRTMDCTDCHNRPAHTFQPSAGRAVDTAIAQNRIPRELPFVRREAVAAVSTQYADRDAALTAIAARVRAFYKDRQVAAPAVDRAVAGAQAVWAGNVFPAMRVTWGTYENQLGHVDAPGCFRCHDESHKSKDGQVISQDCELCHAIQ